MNGKGRLTLPSTQPDTELNRVAELVHLTRGICHYMCRSLADGATLLQAIYFKRLP